MIMESTCLIEAVGECWKYWEIDLGVRGGDTGLRKTLTTGNIFIFNEVIKWNI